MPRPRQWVIPGTFKRLPLRIGGIQEMFMNPNYRPPVVITAHMADMMVPSPTVPSPEISAMIREMFPDLPPRE